MIVAVGGMMQQQQWHRLFMRKAEVAVEYAQLDIGDPGYVCS